jgi:hypothetical protein
MSVKKGTGSEPTIAEPDRTSCCEVPVPFFNRLLGE